MVGIEWTIKKKMVVITTTIPRLTLNLIPWKTRCKVSKVFQIYDLFYIRQTKKIEIIDLYQLIISYFSYCNVSLMDSNYVKSYVSAIIKQSSKAALARNTGYILTSKSSTLQLVLLSLQSKTLTLSVKSFDVKYNEV